ncbi:hypothetical protein D3C81_421620 [compost metagenome]
MATRAGEVAVQYTAAQHRRTGFGHGTAEAAQAQLGNTGFGGAADIGDVAMAQLQQVPGGQVRPLLVVNAHQVGIDAFQLTVDDDHWRAHTGQALQQVVVLAHRGHYQAVDAFFQQHAQVAALLLRVVVGVAQDYAIAVALAGVFDTPRQLGEVRVDAVGHQQADGGRTARLQRARHRTGHVIQFDNGGFHLQPHLFADRTGLVEYMGHGGVRNTRQCRDVFDSCHGVSSAGLRAGYGKCRAQRR